MEGQEKQWNYNDSELQHLVESPVLPDIRIQERRKEFFVLIMHLLEEDMFRVENYPVLERYSTLLEKILLRQPSLFELLGAVQISARSL